MARIHARSVLALLALIALTLFAVPQASAQTATLVKVTNNPTYGTYLTDSQGRALYRFTRDTINTSSACYGQCATAWPPLLVSEGNPVAGAGVDGNLLGVLTRTDGTRQVMFNGMPLYYFAGDSRPGQLNGQFRNNIWFIVKPNTTTIGNQPLTLKATQNGALGPILTDGQGRTLYLFTNDRDNLSVCYEACATNWPPLLVGNVQVQLEGISGTLGSVTRLDGNQQVTYDGKPLYYFIRDAAPGQTNGQGVRNVWYVITPR
jgi:predicted lipoprotein with Yx(FWY)xxD motif